MNMEIILCYDHKLRYNICKGRIELVLLCTNETMAYLVCIMAREKRDIIRSSKVVADLLNLPVSFSFPPLGSTILEPNLSNTKILYILENYQKTTGFVQFINSPPLILIKLKRCKTIVLM